MSVTSRDRAMVNMNASTRAKVKGGRELRRGRVEMTRMRVQARVKANADHPRVESAEYRRAIELNFAYRGVGSTTDRRTKRRISGSSLKPKAREMSGTSLNMASDACAVFCERRRVIMELSRTVLRESFERLVVRKVEWGGRRGEGESEAGVTTLRSGVQCASR